MHIHQVRERFENTEVFKAIPMEDTRKTIFEDVVADLSADETEV